MSKSLLNPSLVLIINFIMQGGEEELSHNHFSIKFHEFAYTTKIKKVHCTLEALSRASFDSHNFYNTFYLLNDKKCLMTELSTAPFFFFPVISQYRSGGTYYVYFRLNGLQKNCNFYFLIHNPIGCESINCFQ